MLQESLLSSLKNLISTGASFAETRLQLISTDVQIARAQFLRHLVLIALTLFFLFFGLVMLALLILIYSWESDRMLVLSLLTSSFLVIGITLTFIVVRSLNTMPQLFEATISELAKDRQELAK